VALSTGSSKVPVRADINVTPMIDVMLVLLIIFMIVTPAITAGFQATIPRAQNAEKREEDQGEIRLGIDRNGKYFLDMVNPATQQYTGPRPVPDADLETRLRDIFGRRTRDKILFLKADESIDFGHVQAAIEIARKAGVRVVGAIAEQKREVRHREGS
jgi:biopolymer transport protein ExbD